MKEQNKEWNTETLSKPFLCIFKPYTVSMTDKTPILFFPSLLPDFVPLTAHHLTPCQSELKLLIAISPFC